MNKHAYSHTHRRSRPRLIQLGLLAAAFLIGTGPSWSQDDDEDAPPSAAQVAQAQKLHETARQWATTAVDRYATAAEKLAAKLESMPPGDARKKAEKEHETYQAAVAYYRAYLLYTEQREASNALILDVADAARRKDEATLATKRAALRDVNATVAEAYAAMTTARDTYQALVPGTSVVPIDVVTELMAKRGRATR